GHLWPSRPLLWGAFAAFFTAVLWFPFAWALYGAVGFAGLPGVPMLMLIALLPLMPAIAETGKPALLAVGAVLALVVFVGIALTGPAFTEDVPRRLNLLYVSDGASGRVYLDSLPGEEPPPPLLDGEEPAPLASFP